MSFRRRRICVVEEGDETALRQNMLALPWERCKFCGMPLLKKVLVSARKILTLGFSLACAEEE